MGEEVKGKEKNLYAAWFQSKRISQLELFARFCCQSAAILGAFSCFSMHLHA